MLMCILYNHDRAVKYCVPTCHMMLFWLLPSGLGMLVTWLSDPDNLNQLVVNQLDSETPKDSVEELCGSDPDRASLTSQEGEWEHNEV